MAQRKENQMDDSYNLDFYKSLSPEAALQEREKGRLPILEISDYPFLVDVRSHLLRPKDNFLGPGLSVDKQKYNYHTGLFSLYYDIPNMKEAVIPANITELPKNIVMIQFPGVVVLDPYMVGKLCSSPEIGKQVISTVPMVMYRKAQEIALKDSPLMAIVNKNIEKLEAKRSKPKTVIHPTAKRSRGH